MDIVRIFHMVDMPSWGKHEFNHIYVVGLKQSYFDPFGYSSVWISSYLFFLSLSLSHWCSSNFHVLVGSLTRKCWLLSSFSYCVFLFSDPRCCSVFSGYMWLPVFYLIFVDGHGVDWSSCGSTHREIDTEVYICYLQISSYYVLFHPFNIHL